MCFYLQFICCTVLPMSDAVNEFHSCCSLILKSLFYSIQSSHFISGDTCTFFSRNRIFNYCWAATFSITSFCKGLTKKVSLYVLYHVKNLATTINWDRLGTLVVWNLAQPMQTFISVFCDICEILDWISQDSKHCWKNFKILFFMSWTAGL